MPNLFARFLLFLSSYFPLALIFFLLFVQRQRWVAVAILAVGLVGLIGMHSYLWLASRLAPTQVTVTSLRRLDAEAMSYIVTYIIPFLAVPFSGWQQGVALSIFFIVLGILYINSNMIHINPMLNLAGYHLYEITVDEGSLQALITRHRVIRGTVLNVTKLGDDIFLEKST